MRASERRRLTQLAVLALTLGAAPAMSSDPAAVVARSAAPDTLELTAEKAVALALHNSRQLQSLSTRVDIQQHRLSSTWVDNPELRIRNLSTRSADNRLDELEVALRWRPPELGQVAEERQRDQVELWERKVEAGRGRDWLASRVWRACADVIMYRELVTIAADRVDNENRRIAQIKSMVDLGRRSIVYYTNARTTVQEARNEHTRHLLALRDEERRLQRLTGADSAIDVIFEELAPVPGPERELLEIAYAHRPEIRLVQERQQLAIDRDGRQRRRRWPQLTFVEASHHRDQGAGDWQEFRFGVDLPLFGRNDGRGRATRLGIARNEIQALAVRERIADEVHDTYAAYGEARLAWQQASADGRTVIGEAARVIGEAAAHGTVPADEVLELERAILDTRATMARRRRELAHAIGFLFYALGLPGPGQAVPVSQRPAPP